MKFFKYSILLIFLALISCNKQEKNTIDKNTSQNHHNYQYNLVVDSLVTIEGKVENGQTFSDILVPNGISFKQLDIIVKKYDSVFNFTKIKPNHKWLILKDSSGQVNYFIYELDKINFIVIDFRDSIKLYKDKHQTKKVTRTAKGIIETSLWNCMKKEGFPAELIIKLSNIFAWTIDFFEIQQGDKFKLYYDGIYIGNDLVDIGKIKGAIFYHNGDTFNAYYYQNNKREGYYTFDGENMRRQFLKAPLNFSRISSRFSRSRLHPILKIRRPHYGIDYAAPIGTPVYSIGDGKVIYTGYNGGAGRMIKIKHNGSFVSAYLHLSRYAKGIKRGVNVKQGQTIGYVGSSGLSTGPHLDFRIYQNGKPINPSKLNPKPLKPLDSNDLIIFRTQIKDYKIALDSLEI